MIRPRSLTLSATATAPSTATEPLKSLGEEDVGELPIARTLTPSTQLKSRRRHSSASPSSSVSSIESLLPVNAEEPPQIDEVTALHPPPPPPSALPHHHFHTPRFDFPPGFFGPYDHYSSYLSPPPASFVPLPPSPGWFPIPPPPQPHSPFLATSSPAFYPSPPFFPYSPPGSPVFPGHEFAPMTPPLSPFLGSGLGGQQEGWILQGSGGTVTPPVPMSPTLLEEAQGETLCEMLDRGEAILSSGHVKYFDVQLGYGFIVDVHAEELDGQDVFVHYTGILQKSGFRCLGSHEQVEYMLTRHSSGRLQALRITGLFGAPLQGLSNPSTLSALKRDSRTRPRRAPAAVTIAPVVVTPPTPVKAPPRPAVVLERPPLSRLQRPQRPNSATKHKLSSTTTKGYIPRSSALKIGGFEDLVEKTMNRRRQGEGEAGLGVF